MLSEGIPHILAPRPLRRCILTAFASLRTRHHGFFGKRVQKCSPNVAAFTRLSTSCSWSQSFLRGRGADAGGG
eukprot:5036335-Alexandrium_andersonii.AAC.1